MPIKYLDSNSLIFVIDLLTFCDILSVTMLRMIFLNSLLSFKRKKDIKTTENNPIVNPPRISIN